MVDIDWLPSNSDPGNDEMFFGDGNLPTNYNISVDDKTDIELGVKIHYRQGDDITPTAVDADGTAHYEVPAGTQVTDPDHNVPSDNPTRAAWNFDFSVNTGLDGSTKTLDDFDFRIIVASGDGEHGVFDLQHVASGDTPWSNSSGTGGFGDEDGSNPQLSQNSVNLGFGFMQAIFGTDAWMPARPTTSRYRHSITASASARQYPPGLIQALSLGWSGNQLDHPAPCFLAGAHVGPVLHRPDIARWSVQ